jgi:hypothetical protein
MALLPVEAWGEACVDAAAQDNTTLRMKMKAGRT